MVDYNKSTVAELRKVLKDRSLPSTGLTRKQQIIEKLEEWDRENARPETAAQVVEAEVDKETQPRDDAPLEAEPTQASSEPVSASVNEESPETLQGETQTAETTSIDAPEDTSTQQPPTPSSGTATIDHAETQAPTATASVSQTPIPSAEEPIATQQIERSAEPSLAPTLSRLNSEERAEEHRKRKRRSDSPPVGTAEAIKKKQKIDEELSGKVHLKEDGGVPVLDSQMEQAHVNADQPAQPAQNEESKSATSEDGDVEMDIGASDSEGKPEEEVPTEPPSKSEDIVPAQTSSDNAAEVITTDVSPKRDQKTSPPSSKPHAKDARYKSLFTPATLDSTETNHADVDSSRDITPALHLATPAIYVGNLMRPIQPQSFRTHLISLASPPNSSPEPSLLKIFYLDPIRTHAFARFDSITAASRVRAALHDVVWPADRARKPLFVDFVPENLVEEWIETEEDAAKCHGRTASARRWEVTYRHSEAFFGEVGGGASSAPHGKPSMADSDFNPPSGPRNTFEQTRPPRPDDDSAAIHPSRRTLVQNSAPAPARYPAAGPLPPAHPARRHVPTNTVTEKPFLTLDALFKSTVAKPKLYYLPVEKEKVDDRLDELDHLTSRDWKGVKGWKEDDEMRKYSFEDDRLVDGGPYRGPAGGRGGSGGGWRGGRGRGR